MNVNIQLFGIFRIDRFKEQQREYPPGTRAQDVIDDLRIPTTLLGIVLINGVHAAADDILTDGDSLALLPLLDGG